MRRHWSHALLTLALVVLTLAMVMYPAEALDASLVGMRIFWDIVFPSLLPFFVLSEVMLAIGIVHFMGVLFEPLMRPLFSVPGEGAFALSMGLAAGFPMDAVITSKFRKQGMCSRVEGERLLAFTNTADPLFIWGAVAVGMFGLPWLGTRLAIAHYVGSLAVGLLFKLHGRREPGQVGKAVMGHGNILARAFRAMTQAKREDGRPFGRLLGDAVTDSVRTLLMIGGFIMVFSVLLRITHVAGLAPLLTEPLGWLFRLLHIDPGLADATFQGVFEIDLGAMAASRAPSPLLQRALIASFIIGWSGLSVHGQVASALSGTDIRMGPYVIARILHGTIAAITTIFLVNGAAPTLGPVAEGPVREALSHVVFQGLPPFWQHLQLATTKALLVPGVLLGIALLGALPPTLQVVWWRLRR